MRRRAASCTATSSPPTCWSPTRGAPSSWIWACRGCRRLASDDDLTASGVTLGTFDYISPEQARDPRSADVRSDIYSLGCTLHYLLTGQPPFPSGNAMQKLLQHQGDEPPDLSRLNPTVPEGLSRIVRKMLAKDPRRRYQDARSLIVDLSLLCSAAGDRVPLRRRHAADARDAAVASGRGSSGALARAGGGAGGDGGGAGPHLGEPAGGVRKFRTFGAGP